MNPNQYFRLMECQTCLPTYAGHGLACKIETQTNCIVRSFQMPLDLGLVSLGPNWNVWSSHIYSNYSKWSRLARGPRTLLQAWAAIFEPKNQQRSRLSHIIWFSCSTKWSVSLASSNGAQYPSMLGNQFVPKLNCILCSGRLETWTFIRIGLSIVLANDFPASKLLGKFPPKLPHE